MGVTHSTRGYNGDKVQNPYSEAWRYKIQVNIGLRWIDNVQQNSIMKNPFLGGYRAKKLLVKYYTV